jgi:hypothetical protein
MHICTSGGRPDILWDGLLWVRVFATREMVMVKHKLKLCDRYVVKERGQHRDHFQSIGCAYSLLAEDGTELGCSWMGNITEHVDHPCAVLHDKKMPRLWRRENRKEGRSHSRTERKHCQR